MIYTIPDSANQPYRPSNGTEGMLFQECFCDKCTRERRQSCKILANTMFYDIDDPKYPKQWTHNEHGQPICTAFRDKTVKRPNKHPHMTTRSAAQVQLFN
jgi:hypothetical protein